MRKLAFATLALGSLLSAGAFAEQSGGTTQQQSRDEMRARMGEMGETQTIPESARRSIRSTFGSSVHAALKGNFEDFVDNLSKGDRDRLDNQKLSNDQRQQLRQAAEQVSADWRNKYKTDASWTSNDSLAQYFRNTQFAPGSNQQHARVTIPGEGGQGQLALNLVDEGRLGSSWHIDAADSLTSSQLQQNLVNHLQMLHNSRDSWPQDANAGAQTVAYHVLQALEGGSTGANR